MKIENKRTENWKQKYTKRFSFYLLKNSDEYKWLESKTNKRAYIVELIKNDMNKNKSVG